VVIQHTQNRDDKAIQLKLNEVIRASEHASDGLISIEDSPEGRAESAAVALSTPR
jgi:low affinity Fe/Cu permease